MTLPALARMRRQIAKYWGLASLDMLLGPSWPSPSGRWAQIFASAKMSPRL